MEKLSMSRSRPLLRSAEWISTPKQWYSFLRWHIRTVIALLALIFLHDESAIARSQRLMVPPQSVTIGGGGPSEGGGSGSPGRLVTLCMDGFAATPSGKTLYPLAGIGGAKVTRLKDNETRDLAAAVSAGWIQLRGTSDYNDTEITSATGDRYRIQVANALVLAEDVQYPKNDIKEFVPQWWTRNGRTVSASKLYDSAVELNDKLWADRKLAKQAEVASLDLLDVEAKSYGADEIAMYRAALDEAPPESAEAAIIPLANAKIGQTTFLVFRREKLPTVVRGENSYSELAKLLGSSASTPRRLALAGRTRNLPYFAAAEFSVMKELTTSSDPLGAYRALQARYFERTWINLMLAYGSEASTRVPFVVSRVPSYPALPDGFIGPLAGGGGGGSINGPGPIPAAEGPDGQRPLPGLRPPPAGGGSGSPPRRPFTFGAAASAGAAAILAIFRKGDDEARVCSGNYCANVKARTPFVLGELSTTTLYELERNRTKSGDELRQSLFPAFKQTFETLVRLDQSISDKEQPRPSLRLFENDSEIGAYQISDRGQKSRFAGAVGSKQ